MTSSDRAKSLIQQIAEERGRGARIRRLFGLAILAIFVGYGFAFWRKATHVDTTKLSANLERSFATTIWPMVSDELDGLAKATVPAIAEAFVGQAEDTMAQVSDTLGKEADIFQGDLHEKMKTSLTRHFREAAATHKTELMDRVPQFTKNEDAYGELLGRLQSSAQQWATDELDSTFKQHVRVLQSINESVQSLQKQATEQQRRGAAPKESAILMFFDILNARFGEE